nr:immunoglobulin light chain junction region [Macaca mulatta]MOV35165.1 immunoglobulin light chain junction region [Macaca mulatta]
CRHGYGTPYSF